MAHHGTSEGALSYGRLSIQVLVAVTGGSALALLGLFAVLLSSRTLAPGVPYGEEPAALIAMGLATAFSALASASAYYAQAALQRGAARAGGVFHAATILAMTLSYLAFAAGGAIFVHFCLAAAPVLARLGGG